jgi:signal peptide peptidase SppA
MMPAFKVHHTATSDKPWDGPANKKRVRSGEKRDYYGRIYAHYDPEGNEGAKETYSFIHHEVAAEGTPGPANETACSTGIGVLNGGRGGTVIPAADRAGVHAHLAAHLKDAGKAAPPLKAQGEVDYPLMAASFFGKCWALEPSKLDEMVALAEALLEGKKIDFPEAAVGKGGLKASDAYEVVGGVALIPVYGVLDKRMNMFSQISGGASYEVLASQVRQAAADPNVQAILLDIDSPGGSVDGVKIAGEALRAARSQKPLVAYGNGQMTSAAYWLGSAANKVVAPDIAGVGSIGVRMIHRDLSGADAQKGIKRTVIYAGKYKNVGSDTGPLSAEDQALFQEVADTYYQLFLEAVAENRGLTPETVHRKMGDGRIFYTGQQAKQAGLIDKIGTLDDAMALAKKLASQPGQKRRIGMDKATLESQHPELFAEVKAQGAAEAKETAEKTGAQLGTEAERARVVEILEAAGLTGIAMQAVTDGLEAKAAFKLFLAHQDQVKAEALATLGSQAPPPVGSEGPKVETTTETVEGSIESRAKAEWDKNPKLQQEYFGKFENFLAYKRGLEDGSVKIISKS